MQAIELVVSDVTSGEGQHRSRAGGVVGNARGNNSCHLGPGCGVGLKELVVERILCGGFVERIVCVEVHHDRVAELRQRTITDAGDATGDDRVRRARGDQHRQHRQIIGIENGVASELGTRSGGATGQYDRAAGPLDRFHLPTKLQRWESTRREDALHSKSDCPRCLTVGGDNRGGRGRISRARDRVWVGIKENLQTTTQNRDIEGAAVGRNLGKLNCLAADHPMEGHDGRECTAVEVDAATGTAD